MARLGEVVAATVEAAGGHELALERRLFGTIDADAIAAAVSRGCRSVLGAEVARYVFFISGSGSVHGVSLADGRQVVVKVHRPAVGRAFLEAVMDLRRGLVARGFSSPGVLAGPIELKGGLATAEELVVRSVPPEPHANRVRRVLAGGLSRFVQAAEGHRHRFEGIAHPMATSAGSLYPPPHAVRLDFGVTARGAEWIDELAEAAASRCVTTTTRVVVAHCDWRVENVSISGDRIVAVYDWDSVGLVEEVAAVAGAALTFTVDWHGEHPRRFPSLPEIAGFVRDYESARGTAFDHDEQEQLCAHMVAALAYGARCELADEQSDRFVPDSQRGMLSALGGPLLDNGFRALGP